MSVDPESSAWRRTPPGPFFGEAQWWEPLIALALLVVTTAAVMLVASKIYTNSLLRMGARVSLREALRPS
jgi:ABC-2 type transport system permease protein